MPQTHNLQPNEIKILKFLEGGEEKEVLEIAKSLDLDQAAVARAALALANERFAAQKTDSKVVAELTSEGRRALKEGLPETNILREIAGEAKKIGEIKAPEKGVALGWAKSKGYVEIKDGMISIQKKGIDALQSKEPEILAIEKIAHGGTPSEKELAHLKSRKLAEYSLRMLHFISATKAGIDFSKKAASAKEEVSGLNSELLKNKKWGDVSFRKYNVTAPVAPAYYGKRHFVSQATEYMRKIYLEMGFKEMEGPLVNPAFWNFDALFTAQDHPVREMQDTFYLDPLKAKLPEKKIVKRVKKAHESGTPGSTGWQYNWSEDEAKNVVLRTHTTVLSARTLASLKKEDLPVKYFAIGKCFRNETLDWKHLFEFNQFEGIVVDKNANFRHLLGYLKSFFKKLGFPQARFRPAYFPYTEMSIEIDVFHPVKKQWVELGGAGIFRPEVVEPLLGEFVPVLAWGPGFDRILMEYYKITDIRDLYKNDVKQLREMKQWMW